ncbi:uncharacterized protein LOC128953425 [Oppia nitens]|uniref:uncharacterized protein LOC128953425 n=1 Tax=Oppia nitens TaxID=1686743 RepID=UPI0023DAEB7C|nr:uncharacterized protein LOC128953425 [Oppia nitens]
MIMGYLKVTHNNHNHRQQYALLASFTIWSTIALISILNFYSTFIGKYRFWTSSLNYLQLQFRQLDDQFARACRHQSGNIRHVVRAIHRHRVCTCYTRELNRVINRLLFSLHWCAASLLNIALYLALSPGYRLTNRVSAGIIFVVLSTMILSINYKCASVTHYAHRPYRRLYRLLALSSTTINGRTVGMGVGIDGSPTSDKMDFEWRTQQTFQYYTVHELRQILDLNNEVIKAEMKLQGYKYQLQGLHIVQQFYQNITHLVDILMPVAYARMDDAYPSNSTASQIIYMYLAQNTEDYRWLGNKLDVRRKNEIRLSAPLATLKHRWLLLQNDLLDRILWAANYIHNKGDLADLFWAPIHYKIHDMFQQMFNNINGEIGKLDDQDIKKAQTLQIFIEDIGILGI